MMDDSAPTHERRKLYNSYKMCSQQEMDCCCWCMRGDWLPKYIKPWSRKTATDVQKITQRKKGNSREIILENWKRFILSSMITITTRIYKFTQNIFLETSQHKVKIQSFNWNPVHFNNDRFICQRLNRTSNLSLSHQHYVHTYKLQTYLK